MDSTPSFSVTVRGYKYIRDLLRQHSGIVLEEDKEWLVESRLCRIARNAGASSVDDLIARLQGTPWSRLHQRALEALMTNETLFFRDLHPFEALRKSILPEVIARRGAERKLNIWCAACATGQEPYSIAMLLREHFPVLQNWSVSLLATDLSSEAIDRAKEGRYNQIEVNRGLPALLLIKYFEKQDTVWQISRKVREMVDFREMNLLKEWPSLPRMDIILLRNVLIYLDLPTKRRILQQALRVLHPEGFLFLGASETPLLLGTPLKTIHFEKVSCYRSPG